VRAETCCSTTRNIAFVLDRDGLDDARRFAAQAVVSYRRACLAVRARVGRRELVEAYLCAKRTSIALSKTPN
jgi:hypothetical protein